jgi:hypothetical protein
LRSYARWVSAYNAGLLSGFFLEPSRVSARPMIIEFIGPTSSGKTTYVRSLLADSARVGIPAALADEIILGRVGRLVQSRKLRSLCVDLIVVTRLLPSVLRFRRQIGALAREALNRSDTLFMRLNLVRNAVKRIVLLHFLTGVERSEVIIFDEGPLQACMNIFVHYENKLDSERLLCAAPELPLAQIIVVVSAEEQAVVARSRVRPDQAFVGLHDHHWAAIKESFESALPEVLAEIDKYVKVIRVASEDPPTALEFWRLVQDASSSCSKKYGGENTVA